MERASAARSSTDKTPASRPLPARKPRMGTTTATCSTRRSVGIQAMTQRVAVIGAGSWGTAVAAITANNASTVLWARRPELADQIAKAHENGDYLAGLAL